MPAVNGVALNPAEQTHYTEHLAPISVVMGIPLLFVNENDYQLGIKYYPDIKGEFMDFHEFNPEHLISNYDVLFMSDLWDRNVFHQKFGLLEKKYGKTLRNVHCPHGFSDKGFYLKKTAMEDITLLYGDNMMDQLKNEGVIQHLNGYAICGNYRYTYFKKHKEFYQTLYEEEIGSQLVNDLPTILYAPTWLDFEESTTFFDSYEFILGNLPNHYNLIVKLHPRLELDNAGLYYHITGKYQDKANILFLRDFPPVYPLLENVDIYIGDMSSIGYDYLIYNRPMFFLNKQRRNAETDRGLYIFKCGVEIRPENFNDLYNIIDATDFKKDAETFGEVRSNVWEYTFGQELSFADLRKAISKEINS